MKLRYSLYIYVGYYFTFSLSNESYWQSPEKTQNSGEHEKRYNINTWFFLFDLLML